MNKKYITAILTVIAISVSVIIGTFFYFGEKRHAIDTKYIKKIETCKAEIDSLELELQFFEKGGTELQRLVDSDRRLYQHVQAVKWQNKPFTKENIKQFLIDAEVLQPDRNFGVALKETGLRAGTAKYYNYHGFKRARSRFTWSEGKKSGNNAYYQAWPYSFLDYDEYIRSGAKNWSDFNKKAFHEIAILNE